METSTKPFTISNLLDIYSRIYTQFDKDNISVIEAEMRKIVPSDESQVFMAGGANFTDHQISVNLFVSKPLPIEQCQAMSFVEILQKCILKADATKLKTIYECADFLENSERKYFFIDGTYPSYNQETGNYYFHFNIFKNKRRKKYERR